MDTGPIGVIVRCARSFYQVVGNRRKYERLPISESIRATHRGSVVENTQLCRGVDVSPRGIAIDCPEPLLPEMLLDLQFEDGGSRLARVRYCRQNGESYRVGLQFVPRGNSSVPDEPW